MTQRPTCAEARPATCPCCGAAGRPLGKPLTIVGHGFVERQFRGPLVATGPPQSLVLQLRRYRCRACKAILVVGPPGRVRRRWYGAGAIALALEAFSRGETSVAVRRRVSPDSAVGGSAHERWVTITRWADAAGEGRLFGTAALEKVSRRQAAELVVLALAGRGGHVLGADFAEAAFDGAEIAA